MGAKTRPCYNQNRVMTSSVITGLKCIVDNIFVLHSLITHCVNEKKKLYSAFIDFKKAFDFVVRDVLWFRLVTVG